MKHFLLYFLTLIFIGCHFSNQQNSNNNDTLINKPKVNFIIDSSYGKIKDSIQTKELSKKVIYKVTYSYYKYDTLHIITNDKKEVQKFYIQFRDSTKNNLSIDTKYYVEQYQIKENLFIAVVVPTETIQIVLFYGLINMKNNEWMVRQRLVDTLFNASYESSSYDNKYHLFLDHTGNDAVGIRIFNSNNKILKNAACYFPSNVRDNFVLKWQVGDKLYYYFLENEYLLPKNLPPLKGYSDKFARKYYWIDGIDSLTNEYFVVTIE